ncbi:hypothetical protein [Fodinicola feengrottensis]|uniref:hypothetical protein n=1 Tax=Fodinicola feengrottensis TaxID=435914 RepID=UPI0013D0F912|nr:hypothetical protein [Fodinicola feengrottensis]
MTNSRLGRVLPARAAGHQLTISKATATAGSARNNHPFSSSWVPASAPVPISPRTATKYGLRRRDSVMALIMTGRLTGFT